MDGNIRSAPLADRLRIVQAITDCRSLKVMLASFRVRFRGALRLSEYGCVIGDSKRAVHFYRVKRALCRTSLMHLDAEFTARLLVALSTLVQMRSAKGQKRT